MKKMLARRATVAASLAAVAVAGLTSVGAGAAAATPLPAKSFTQKLADGTVVTVKLFDESYTVARPITSIPLSRQVWASGKVLVNAPGATGGTIDAGYIVGCQVNFLGSGGDGIQGGVNVPLTGGAVTPSLGAGQNVSIGPGQAAQVHLIQNTNGDLSPQAGNYLTTTNSFTGSKAGVAYSQEQFNIDSCAGYAEAKAFVTVQIDTDALTGYVTLYGKPFSLG